MVAPEGWEIVELISLSDGGMQNGLFYNNERKFRGIPIINVGDMYNQVPIVSKRLALFNATHTEIKSFAVNDGDLFFTRSSVVPDGIAFCNWYKQTSKIPVVFDSHVIRFRTNKNKVLPMFLYLQCISRYARMFFLSNAKTAAMTTIDQTVIGKCSILLPPLPEQRRIAEVLSDTDLYITTLERLIAKKEAVKQGVMQELLTGKRRLPGFKGEWVEKMIDYYGIFISGSGFPVIYQNQKKGIYPFYKVGDFNNIDNEYIMITANNYISQATASILKCPIVPCGSIIFAKIGAAIFLERKRQNKYDCCIDNNMMAFTVNDNGNSKYIMYLFQSIKFSDMVTSTALPSLSSKQLKSITKFFPPTLAEQTAIAEILSDMDAELSALKKKLEKIRLIKQGMMDALLTGKIRLPEDKPNVQFTQRKEQEEILYAAEKTEGYTAEAKKAKHHANSEGYQDAVILAALVHRFGTKNFPFTAFDCQKFPYLFYRYMEGQTKGYRKFAAGPYNPALKYKTARPIALKKKYIQDHIGKYRGFISGINVQEALNYFQQWYGNEPLAWFEQFRYIPKRKDELELLTTTDMSMVEIRGEGRNITVQSVKELMKKNPEWKDKLNRPIFSDNNIERAIKWSYDLFGGEHD